MVSLKSANSTYNNNNFCAQLWSVDKDNSIAIKNSDYFPENEGVVGHGRISPLFSPDLRLRGGGRRRLRRQRLSRSTPHPALVANGGVCGDGECGICGDGDCSGSEATAAAATAAEENEEKPMDDLWFAVHCRLLRNLSCT